jgi:DNA-binding MarR family transcriptional regulator
MNEAEKRTQAIMRSFRKVNRVMYRLLREEAELLDTTVVQLLVLRELDEGPNIGLSELAGRLQLGNSTMSGVVERLVSADLVVRERSSEDRRSLTMRLTPEGEEKKNEAFGERSLLVGKLERLLEIPQEDLRQLFRVHDLILEKLQPKGDETENGEIGSTIDTKHQ